MSQLKFLVRYNTHEFADCSDKPRSAYRIVEADTNAEARDIVCAMRANNEQVGKRWIGAVHQAELYLRPTGTF